MPTDQKVSEMGAANTPLNAIDILFLVQGGVGKSVSLSAIEAFIAAQAKADAAQAAAIASANGYTDSEIAAALVTAAGYASTAESNAGSYTDSEIAALDTALRSFATGQAQLPANLVTAAASLAAALNVNSQRISGLADATAATDALRVQRVESTVDVDISSGSGGTFNLTSTHLSYGHINLTGTLSGDVIVKFPTGLERNVRMTSSTTGTAVCRVEGYTSGFTYLLPRQHRKLYHGADVLRCEAHRVLYFTDLVTLAGDTLAGTPVDHTLCKLPADTTIKVARARVTTAITGSTSQISMGYTGTYDRILKLASISTLGTLIGNNSDELGTDWDVASKKFGAYLTGSETVKLRHAIAGANCTAGVVRVTLVAEYEGELQLLPHDAEARG